MKLLWISNIVLPKSAHLIGEKPIVFGGWISQMIDQLSAIDSVDINVVTKTSAVSKVQVHKHENVTYYFVPESATNRYDAAESDCQYILEHCNPDILHAEGTEQQFTYRMLKLWKGQNSVSMQGIINGYEPYEYGLIPMEKLLFSANPWNWLFASVSILNKHFRFKPRLKFERETIILAKNIFGRTLWDRAHSFAINSNAPYFHCRRTLRPAFYQEWDRNEIEDFSLFIGNASNPRKGAHYVIEALQMLKTDFPKIKLCIAGLSPFPGSRWDIKKKIGYPNYLLRLIKKHKLLDRIEFTGILTEREMADKLTKTKIFVMPSTIENSPNTLGEAMMLGVPTISAFTGGIAQMGKDEDEILYYRDNDPAYLAYQIRRLFTDSELYEKLSKQGRARALLNHDKNTNLKDLMNGFTTINDSK